MTDLQIAHDRAVRAVIAIAPLTSDDEAVELVDAMAALVLETLKAALPAGEETCN